MAKDLFPYEIEKVEFSPSCSQPYRSLWPILTNVGFTHHDGVWFLTRQDAILNGQGDSNGSVSIFFEGEELYLYEEEILDTEENAQWDKIVIGYLLASLPENCIGRFISCIGKLSASLQLPVVHNGKETTPSQLQEIFHGFCKDLEKEYGGAGSKTIQHFIDIHYS